MSYRGFPIGSVVKNLPANAGDMGSIPGQGRSYILWSNEAPAQLPSLYSRVQELQPWIHVPQLFKPGCPRACATQQEKPP